MEEHVAEPEVGTSIIGIEPDPGRQILLGRIPLPPCLSHRSGARVAADLKIPLPLGVVGKGSGQLGGPIEEHRRVSDPPILKCQVGQHEVGLRVARKLDDSLFEFGAGGHQLVHAQPEHGHHHTRGRQFAIVVACAFQDRPAAVDVAIAKPLDRVVDVLVFLVVRYGLADQRFGSHLCLGNLTAAEAAASGKEENQMPGTTGQKTLEHVE